MSNNKNVIYNNVNYDAREVILEASRYLNSIIGSTLGVNGKNVIYRDLQTGRVKATKDGLNITKSIFHEDSAINLVVSIIKEASLSMAESVGDGSTSIITFIDALLNSVTDVKKAKSEIREAIKQLHAVTKFDSSPEMAYKVAMISSNQDEEISNMIKKAYSIDKDVYIRAGKSVVENSDIKIIEGVHIPSLKLLSSYFVNDSVKNVARIRDAKVILIDSEKAVSSFHPLKNVFMQAQQKKTPLVIVYNNGRQDGEDLVKFCLEFNNQGVPCKMLTVDNMGAAKEDAYDVLSKVFNTPIINDSNFNRLPDTINLEDIISADEVEASVHNVTITTKHKNEKVINELKEKRDAEEDLNEKARIQRKIDNISTKIAEINLAYRTATAMNVGMDRLEDTILHVREAMMTGIVPAGGHTMAYMSQITNFEQIGWALNSIRHRLHESSFGVVEFGVDEFGKDYDLMTGEECDYIERGYVESSKMIEELLITGIDVVETLINSSIVLDLVKNEE